MSNLRWTYFIFLLLKNRKGAAITNFSLKYHSPQELNVSESFPKRGLSELETVQLIMEAH